ncbi:MAG: hypothetical protein K2J67_02720, partial [Lachnospiraceae bacterium]|nr:hypothetical protein [Lachnospiraceae bacterium]
VITQGITMDSWGLLLVLLFGGGTMVVALSYAGVPFLAGIRNHDQGLPTLLGAFFIIVGLILLLSACYKERWKKDRCIYPLQAKCIAIDCIKGLYVITWKYTYNGKEYRYQSSDRSNWQGRSLPDLYEMYLLWINPSNPEEAYSPIDPSWNIQKFLGAAFIAFGILVFYYTFYK